MTGCRSLKARILNEPHLGSGVSEVDIHRRTPMDYGDRINPPPDSGPDWWWTGKRWRKSPPRAMSIDREGLHAVVGAVFGVSCPSSHTGGEIGNF